MSNKTPQGMWPQVQPALSPEPFRNGGSLEFPVEVSDDIVSGASVVLDPCSDRIIGVFEAFLGLLQCQLAWSTTTAAACDGSLLPETSARARAGH